MSTSPEFLSSVLMVVLLLQLCFGFGSRKVEPRNSPHRRSVRWALWMALGTLVIVFLNCVIILASGGHIAETPQREGERIVIVPLHLAGAIGSIVYGIARFVLRRKPGATPADGAATAFDPQPAPPDFSALGGATDPAQSLESITDDRDELDED